MRVKHNTLSEKEFLHLLKSGSVGGFDGVVTRANGLEDINIFRRHGVARGSGWFSNIFSKYGPKVLPFLKKYIFPSAKQFGKDVISDMVSGDTSLKQSLKNRGKESLKNVGKNIVGRGRRKKMSKNRKIVGKRKSKIRRHKKIRKIRSVTGTARKKRRIGKGGAIRKGKNKSVASLRKIKKS